MGDIPQMNLAVDGGGLIRYGGIHLGQVYAVFFRGVEDVQGRQKTWYVASRFPWQPFVQVPEIIQIVDVLCFDDTQDTPFTTIIGG